MTEPYFDLEIDVLEEISAVDNPAQPAARAVIFKRHATAMADGSFQIETLEDLKKAILDVPKAGDLQKAIAHITSRAVALGASDLIPEDFGKTTRTNKEDMTNTNDPAEQLLAVNKQLTAITAELAIAKAVGEFSDAEKAFYSGLDASGQEAFRKASKTERAEKVRVADQANDVVYKSLDGVEFRKSDDPRLVAMAKARDEDRKALLIEKAARLNEQFSKRAATELSNMTGSEKAKVAVLKALETLSSDELTEAKAFLKAANDALGAAFKERGTSTGDESADGASAAVSKLDSLATAYAKQHAVSFEKAYGAIMETPEGRALYAETVA